MFPAIPSPRALWHRNRVALRQAHAEHVVRPWRCCPRPLDRDEKLRLHVQQLKRLLRSEEVSCVKQLLLLVVMNFLLGTLLYLNR